MLKAMTFRVARALPGVVLAAATAALAGQQPARDSSAAPQAAAAPPTARISGRVSTADTGRPLKGARVTLTAPTLSGGRSLTTDESGTFDFQDLPAGRYTLAGSKAGFVTLSYGQRRPLQPGTPLQLDAGQTLRDIEVRLPRGSAIGGQVSDETGEPVASIMVRAMRLELAQGQRRLVQAGMAQTDDRGQYRIWGLHPGEYYVSAVAPNMLGRGFMDWGRGRGGRGAPFLLPGGDAGPTTDEPAAPGLRDGPLDDAQAAANPQQRVAYAPTYYPGVSSTREARPVTTGLASETLGIDFALLLVRMARVSGRATSSDGGAVTGGTVTLVSDDQGGGRGGPLGGSYGTRIEGDGTFTIVNVPPGSYNLRARSDAGGGRAGRGAAGARGAATDTAAGAAPGPAPRFGSQPLHVSGDLSDVPVVLSPGATVTGAVVLQASGASHVSDLSQVRVFARPADPAIGQETGGRVDRGGAFTIDAIPAGPHWLRAQAPAGLMVKSVLVGGRDATDVPYTFDPGERIGGVSIVLTDRSSAIVGTIGDERGAPVTDFTVLAFPEDASLWGPQSRHIVTARPDQHGRFQLRGLPAGRYHLVAIDPIAPGEWFDTAYLEGHRSGAARVTLAEGETKTQDFRVDTRQ
jgi:hypothetical protein